MKKKIFLINLVFCLKSTEKEGTIKKKEKEKNRSEDMPLIVRQKALTYVRVKSQFSFNRCHCMNHHHHLLPYPAYDPHHPFEEKKRRIIFMLFFSLTSMPKSSSSSCDDKLKMCLGPDLLPMAPARDGAT